MPAATNRDDLIAACEREFAKLSGLLDGVTEAEASAPDADGWSIRDVIAHRAHWIALFLRWWSDGRAGREVHMPDAGVGWGDLKTYNAALRDRNAELSHDEARKRLRDGHGALMDLLDRLDDADLYGGPMVGGNGKWTAGRYAEAAGASHYRSAAKFVRGRLRSLRG